MEKTDLYIGIMDNAKLDSLHKTALVKIESLETMLSNHLVSESYFSDILSHQWTLLSIQTAIFVVLLVLLSSVVYYISWKNYKKIKVRLKTIEQKYKEIPPIVDRLNTIDKRASRAIYETPSNPDWKIVWHIRYLAWFVANLAKDENGTLEKDLILRCLQLRKEYEVLKANTAAYNKFKNFENKTGLKEILFSLIKLDIKEVSQIAIEILSDLQ